MGAYLYIIMAVNLNNRVDSAAITGEPAPAQPAPANTAAPAVEGGQPPADAGGNPPPVQGQPGGQPSTAQPGTPSSGAGQQSLDLSGLAAATGTDAPAEPAAAPAKTEPTVPESTRRDELMTQAYTQAQDAIATGDADGFNQAMATLTTGGEEMAPSPSASDTAQQSQDREREKNRRADRREQRQQMQDLDTTLTPEQRLTRLGHLSNLQAQYRTAQQQKTQGQEFFKQTNRAFVKQLVATQSRDQRFATAERLADSPADAQTEAQDTKQNFLSRFGRGAKARTEDAAKLEQDVTDFGDLEFDGGSDHQLSNDAREVRKQMRMARLRGGADLDSAGAKPDAAGTKTAAATPDPADPATAKGEAGDTGATTDAPKTDGQKPAKGLPGARGKTAAKGLSAEPLRQATPAELANISARIAAERPAGLIANPQVVDAGEPGGFTGLLEVDDEDKDGDWAAGVSGGYKGLLCRGGQGFSQGVRAVRERMDRQAKDEREGAGSAADGGTGAQAAGGATAQAGAAKRRTITTADGYVFEVADPGADPETYEDTVRENIANVRDGMVLIAQSRVPSATYNLGNESIAARVARREEMRRDPTGAFYVSHWGSHAATRA